MEGKMRAIVKSGVRRVGHAAALLSSATSTPSVKLTPSMTLARRRKPHSLRQDLSAPIAHACRSSTASSGVWRSPSPELRWRMVAKANSVTLAVRMCCQREAGRRGRRAVPREAVRRPGAPVLVALDPAVEAALGVGPGCRHPDPRPRPLQAPPSCPPRREGRVRGILLTRPKGVRPYPRAGVQKSGRSRGMVLAASA